MEGNMLYNLYLKPNSEYYGKLENDAKSRIGMNLVTFLIHMRLSQIVNRFGSTIMLKVHDFLIRDGKFMLQRYSKNHRTC